VATFPQSAHGMAADIACPTRHENARHLDVISRWSNT
jgi:hypothetical protein